jgi:hypothetical protein
VARAACSRGDEAHRRLDGRGTAAEEAARRANGGGGGGAPPEALCGGENDWVSAKISRGGRGEAAAVSNRRIAHQRSGIDGGRSWGRRGGASSNSGERKKLGARVWRRRPARFNSRGRASKRRAAGGASASMRQRAHDAVALPPLLPIGRQVDARKMGVPLTGGPGEEGKREKNDGSTSKFKN